MGLTMLQVLTGRPSVLWHDGAQKVNLIDFCEDGADDVASIMDPRAKWLPSVAAAVLELGLACTAGTGRRAVKLRPSVAHCIQTLRGLVQLPMLLMPLITQKECVVCFDAPRGQHRFLPCECECALVFVLISGAVGKHSVCCGDCAKMLKEKGSGCAVCSQPIQGIQEGVFMDTFSG